jgi:hypothetical protein
MSTPTLVHRPAHPYLCAMRASLLLPLALLVLAQPAAAQTKTTRPAPPPAHPSAAAAAPKAIGKFEDWTAATNVEAGQKVCYAFTRAQGPTPGRTDAVLLTVTQRQGGRDAVSISAGFEYAANAAVAVQADGAAFDFYTAKRSAFARDGHAAVVAFLKSGRVTAKSPGPRNAPVSDVFSLKGFEHAYAAINKECPAK